MRCFSSGILHFVNFSCYQYSMSDGKLPSAVHCKTSVNQSSLIDIGNLFIASVCHNNTCKSHVTSIHFREKDGVGGKFAFLRSRILFTGFLRTSLSAKRGKAL